MVNKITVQNMLNGPAFDVKFMLEKAGREFDRLKNAKNPYFAYDHVMNLSITLAAIADWNFHLKLADENKWIGKSESNFCNWVRSKSEDASAFFDISNESKHANRKVPNFTASKVVQKPLWDFKNIPKNELDILLSKGYVVSTDKGELPVVWMVKLKNNEDYFYDVIERAIEFWKNVDLSVAIPLDKNLRAV